MLGGTYVGVHTCMVEDIIMLGGGARMPICWGHICWGGRILEGTYLREYVQFMYEEV